MFGIAPNLKITGQDVTVATRQEIANALHLSDSKNRQKYR